MGWASPALRAGHQQVAKCHGYVEFGDQFQAPRLSPYRTAGTIADDGILRFDAGHAVRTALIERTVDARHSSVAGVVGRVFFMRAKNG